MALYKQSAIKYNNDCGYSQKAIGIIQMFVRARTVGYFDNQTVEAVYKMQQSPLYGFKAGSADGMVGPSTLGVIIMELEYVSRLSEAAVLKSYCYKINGKLENEHKKPEVYVAPKSPELPPEPEDPKTKDVPRAISFNELRNMPILQGSLLENKFPHEPILVGDLKLATDSIRRVLSVTKSGVYFFVVQTDGKKENESKMGKFFHQTAYGFLSDLDSAALAQVGRSGKGGQIMMKKMVELMMGAAFAAAGGLAGGGVGVIAFISNGAVVITATGMNFLLSNSEDIFKIAHGIEKLMAIKTTLENNTPEFWRLCKIVLRLSVLKTPEALWADPYACVRIVTELVISSGKAILLKEFKATGLIKEIIEKLLKGFFGKLTDAASLALAGKDLVKLMKEYDPSLDEARAARIVKELRDNWHIVQPALNTMKAIADTVVG